MTREEIREWLNRDAIVLGRGFKPSGFFYFDKKIHTRANFITNRMFYQHTYWATLDDDGRDICEKICGGYYERVDFSKRNIESLALKPIENFQQYLDMDLLREILRLTNLACPITLLANKKYIERRQWFVGVLEGYIARYEEMSKAEQNEVVGAAWVEEFGDWAEIELGLKTFDFTVVRTLPTPGTPEADPYLESREDLTNNHDENNNDVVKKQSEDEPAFEWSLEDDDSHTRVKVRELRVSISKLSTKQLNHCLYYEETKDAVKESRIFVRPGQLKVLLEYCGLEYTGTNRNLPSEALKHNKFMKFLRVYLTDRRKVDKITERKKPKK